MTYTPKSKVEDEVVKDVSQDIVTPPATYIAMALENLISTPQTDNVVKVIGKLRGALKLLS